VIDASEVIRRWDLNPHPEGGHYRRIYRSALTTTPHGWPGPRALATSILYLLAAGERTRWHRVRGEELWLWQGGGPMSVDVDGTARIVGHDRGAGHELQLLVPAGSWQSATPAEDHWSIVACVVAPGFDFDDFEMR